MFAFILFDHAASTVFAARDHMGICPLYIAYGHDGSVWFASEMKSFVNEPRIARYEIFPPGHYYHGGPGTVNGFVRWYSPSWMMEPDAIPTKPADLALIRDTLVESVVKRLMADVPYGVLLSGGLDSSLVTSIAVRAACVRMCVCGCAMRVRAGCCARIGRGALRAHMPGRMPDALRAAAGAPRQAGHQRAVLV
jgi:asparagine synthetase B (glutamine-hydrolysing)